MKPRALIAACLTATCVSPFHLQAQGSSAYLGSVGTRAVDAKGVRHNGYDYPRKHPPWLDDIVKTVAPDYPFSDRAHHHEGVGWFQLILDQKTGAVMRVTVIKSTGFSSLDNCAVAALRKWRWKPGKWREVRHAGNLPNG